MSLATPERIRTLQRALYMKAKQEPTRRFHFLYDKVWRKDILAHAYALSCANGGVPGGDGKTFSRIKIAPSGSGSDFIVTGQILVLCGQVAISTRFPLELLLQVADDTSVSSRERCSNAVAPTNSRRVSVCVVVHLCVGADDRGCYAQCELASDAVERTDTDSAAHGERDADVDYDDDGQQLLPPPPQNLWVGIVGISRARE